MHSEMCWTLLAESTRCKNYAKNRQLCAPSHNFVGIYLRNQGYRVGPGSHCPLQAHVLNLLLQKSVDFKTAKRNFRPLRSFLKLCAVLFFFQSCMSCIVLCRKMWWPWNLKMPLNIIHIKLIFMSYRHISEMPIAVRIKKWKVICS